MNWRKFISNKEKQSFPWIGTKKLISYYGAWTIESNLPDIFGWHSFELKDRKAFWVEPSIPQPLKEIKYGYLVGDRFVPDNIQYVTDIKKLTKELKKVYLIEGVDHFSRVSVGKFYDDGPLIFNNLEMPLGVEADILNAFLENKDSILDISGITPALNTVFKVQTLLKKEKEEKRRYAELQKEMSSGGSGYSRRKLLKHDLEEALRASLNAGGATYLDHRLLDNNELCVRFSVCRQRFECICDKNSLRIIDSGICLTAEYDSDEYERGTKGDNFFTLESLPSVIREAMDKEVLVVFRHAD